MKYNVLAVILARGGSKGIPKKNIYIAANEIYRFTYILQGYPLGFK